jgi:hypothetical protein
MGYFYEHGGTRHISKVKEFFSKHVWDLVLSLVLVASSSALLAYYFWPKPASDNLYAYVYISAKLTQLEKGSDFINLTSVKDEKSYTVQGKEEGDKGKMVITVKSGAIAVTESGCSNQFCVKQGYVSRAGESIICAPNELLITLKGVDDSEIVI